MPPHGTYFGGYAATWLRYPTCALKSERLVSHLLCLQLDDNFRI